MHVKSLKILGLLVAAAIAGSALLGAGSASAAVLCTSNEDCSTSHTSEEGEMLDAGDVLVGTAENLVLTGTPEVTCAHSLTEVEVTGANPIEGELSTLEFSGCAAKTVLGNVACNVQVENLPYTGTVTKVGSNGNGRLEATAISGEPSAFVTCAGFIECAFGNSVFDLAISGGDPVKITANKLPLKIKSGGFLCPSEALWDASYEAVGSITSVFVR